MAVTFEITSSREVTVNGIGLLRVDEPVQVDEIKAAHFEAEHGYRLSEANFPEYVRVTAVLTKENQEGKEV